MQGNIQSDFDEVNKLIFVKHYAEAEKLLNKLMDIPESRLNLLFQLRRVELAIKLEKIDVLRDYFVKMLGKNPENSMHWELSVLFAEQHGEMISDTEAVSRFQNIIEKYGPSAPAYFGIGFSMECQENFERAIFNYDQALKLDSSWYPAYFGLSQINYNKGEEQIADHYFYLFEQAAPYNLYGNFETHKNLSAEFLEHKKYNPAEAAIVALSDWWTENKGFCPPEIQIYEALSIAKIAEAKGDNSRSEQLRSRAIFLANQALQNKTLKEGVLYFIAKILEEFSEFDLAFKFFKLILTFAGSNPGIVQKIGSQFLSIGEHKMAKELFDEAYQFNPDNPEIRFCRLVSHLKVKGVNVEEYLLGRERLGKIIETKGDKVELLALLHSLLAKHQDDADVHAHIASVYLRLGNVERAKKHFDTMFELDGRCRDTAIKYAGFIMRYGGSDKAIEILNSITINEDTDSELVDEIKWLKSGYYYREKKYLESLNLIRSLLKVDPWNVSYIAREIACLSEKLNAKDKEIALDNSIVKLSQTDEGEIDWNEFDQVTAFLNSEHHYELVYSRSKLSFLYRNADMSALKSLISAASAFDASKGTYDFIRLLNTNFDGAEIYLGLGLLFKELWQLETASMWFEQSLLHSKVSPAVQAKAYIELADCYSWQNLNLEKAIEYSKISLDLSQEKNHQIATVMAHAYLKQGKMREAKLYLDQIGEMKPNPEATYLQGLYFYRNGQQKQANKVWKPLLTTPSLDLKLHNIKQEVLRYYFDQDPYLKTHFSA
ncbi:MAG: tetratricopeptide repeat protein [Bdellovibrionota bacterium]